MVPRKRRFDDGISWKPSKSKHRGQSQHNAETHRTSGMMPIPLTHAHRIEPHSRPAIHPTLNPKRPAGLSQFQFALALWAESACISRDTYGQLREVLCLLDCEEVQALPKKLDTLNVHMCNELPMLPLHQRDVDVPKHIQSTERSATGREKVKSPQFWYDLDQLFSAILQSHERVNTLHFGMAEYSDNPQELWHSRAWGSSVCTVSGEYALSRYNQILFPGDFVEFSSMACKLFDGVCYGRVIFVGVDKRLRSIHYGKTVLTVQPVILSSCLPVTLHMNRSEFVLVEDYCLEVEDRSVRARVDMALDRGLQLALHTARVCFVLTSKNWQLRSTLKLHSLRAELEVMEYGRNYLEAWHSVNQRVRSLPILIFIDDFGIHRNMYRALKAFYMTLAGLPYCERSKVSNTFTLTLGPHGAEMADVVSSFKDAFRELMTGKWVLIHGEMTLVNINLLALTADMPQQATNSGVLAHQAEIGCRSCYCPKGSRGDLRYDVVSNGRYHFDTGMKRAHAMGIGRRGDQNTYFRSIGLRETPSPLRNLVPSLDLTLACAYDIPHSEWKGLGERLQDMLCRDMLRGNAVHLYYRAFQSFVPPVKWPRIQSPQHRFSWSLSENGRAILLTPLILRCNAMETWFRPATLAAASTTLLEFQTEPPMSTSELIVHAFALFASATSKLSSVGTTDVGEIRKNALLSRHVFQALVLTAARMHPRDLTREDVDSAWPPRSQDLWKCTKLPNLHVALHFAEFAAEYGSIMSCNVLCGERKHKIWKQWADHAAPKHLMAYLFKRDRFRQSLQLALVGSADAHNGELYTRLAWLAERCPQLISPFVLHREEGSADDDIHGSHVHTFGTENRLDQVLQDLNVFIRHHTPQICYSESFWTKLERDYQSRDGRDQIVVDHRSVDMYTGVRFLDANWVSRCYNTGTFLSCGQRYCQVLAIAKYSGHLHIDYFLVVRYLEEVSVDGRSEDHMLNLPFYGFTIDWDLIRLQSMQADPVFFIDLSLCSGVPGATSSFVVHCPWRINYV